LLGGGGNGKPPYGVAGWWRQWKAALRRCWVVAALESRPTLLLGGGG
jgi:hypothetical protein